MQEIDRAIKIVLTQNPNSVLDLAFGSRRTIRLKAIADSQINLPELRADKALVVEEAGKVRYLIFEAMLQPQQRKLLGFALKTFGNQYLLKKPTVLVIVYLRKGKYASFPDGFENRVGGLSTQFRCTKILLWEHEARIVSGELKEFAPFLPLFRKHPGPAFIKVQKKLLTQITDPELRADLTAAAILVDIRVFGAKVVVSHFTKKELTMLKETDFIREWLSESLQEGKREGKREGNREGKREGKLSILEIILAQKFGALSSQLRSQLLKLDEKKLDRLTLKLQNITSRKDLQAWLRNGASGNSGKP
jgi:hypothetical protein